MNHRKFLNVCLLALVFGLIGTSGAFAQTQTPLPGSAIPQFVDPLPSLDTITAGAGQIELRSTEFLSPVMPSTFVPATGTYSGTYVWGYQRPGQAPGGPYIGPVIVATRGTPTEVKWVNNLGFGDTTNVLAYRNSTDQTIHWADPLMNGMNHCAHNVTPMTPPSGMCGLNYVGPVPDVTHLHGAETPAEIDGGPEAWYVSDGSKHGGAFYTKDGSLSNYSIYRYLNVQDAASLWFHPHPLGVTRLNVFAGLAGAYVLTDPGLSLPAGLPGPADIIPLVIQDRMFDVNGQLYFPNLGLNVEHPYWIPEFVGDTIVINGKVWPTLGTAAAPIQAKRYRFLFLNGSNARTYEMYFPGGPPFWVIGTDGGYLDAPVKVDPAMGQKLLIMPGERYDVIIDFTAYANKTLTLRNTGRTPFPKGPPPNGTTLGQMLRVFVGPAVADTSYNPASGIPLRAVGQKIVRLPGTPGGPAITAANVQKTRQLTLNEVMGPGGPVEILVNNTKWDGNRINTVYGTREPIPGSTLDATGMNWLTELPVEGETEVWEIVNTTADAHPIHLHLVQFQLINREPFNASKYATAYSALFPASVQLDPMTGLPYPGGVFIGGYGPPLDYFTGNLRALGGNPDITPYLQGKPQPPLPHEQGWKDTTIMYPGMVTRIAVRYAPQDTLVGGTPMYYPFDPSGADYVWHCHILDHEDNEMMRPYQVISSGAPRSYAKGLDY